ncbi:MAG: toast rack family protein [Anaerolineaceae bacterium]|nr:toast rack family protein [Anaerolineaceae bacterium]
MKSQIWIALSVFMVVTLACTISLPVDTAKTGETQTLNINEPAPADSSNPAKLSISMGAGTLQIASGASGLVEGSVRYNVTDWKPVVTRQSDGATIKIDTQLTKSIPNNNVINDWNLKLGNVPMDFTLQAGAYSGTVDLSGIPLTNLSISDGASSAKVLFNAPNPVKMNNLSYKTGASTVELDGLANANFTDMTFDGGAGSYTLDFSGNLQQPANALITAGVSNVTINVPANSNTQVTITGALNDVNADGTFNIDGKIYRTGGSGPLLNITVDMSVGSLDLVSK